MIKQANSGNPKTEMSWQSRAKFNGVDKCVETIYLPSRREDEIVHSLWKHEGESVDPGLRKIFMDEYNAPEGQRENLYGIEKSNKAVEYDLGVGGTGDLTEFDGTIAYDDFKQQYRVSYSHKEWCKGMKIERKLVDRVDSLSTLNSTKSVELLNFN